MKCSHFEGRKVRRRNSSTLTLLTETIYGEMAMIQAILQLKALHWSNRRIAEHLEIDRATVTRHLKRHAREANAAISPPGSEARVRVPKRAKPNRADKSPDSSLAASSN
jgi:IS30 family transposase